MRIRIQGLPFRVLVMLLERAGDVVTREEFRRMLWPEDTFVDFDHSLSTAINKILEALGDSAMSFWKAACACRRSPGTRGGFGGPGSSTGHAIRG